MMIKAKFKDLLFLLLFLFLFCRGSEVFNYSLSSAGLTGAINTPNARIFEEGSFNLNLYRGDPDRRLIISASPYDWFEASLFYSSIKGRKYSAIDDTITQDYKDKGFNFKIILKDQGKYPAVALGIYDLAGTGLYDSEFIVGSYAWKKFDLSLGVGWGNLAGGAKLKNPLIDLREEFLFRPAEFEDSAGQFNFGRYFSGKNISPFGSIIYQFNRKLNFIAEYDSIVSPGIVGFPDTNTNLSFGAAFRLNNNLTLQLARERNSLTSFSLRWKQDVVKNRDYHKPERSEGESDYQYLKKILAMNAIGISELQRSSNQVRIQFSQFEYFTSEQLESVINRAISDSGFQEEVVKSFKIAGLNVDAEAGITGISFSPSNRSFHDGPIFRNKTGVNIRPFLAGREDFIKVAALLENDTEIVFTENLFFTGNLKLSIFDNFDDLVYPPKDTYPNQVRSDIKNYLNNIGESLSIGRAQLDYHITPYTHNHLMFTAGILEDMYAGYGMEYLWFNLDNNYAVGFEVFNAYKRGYKFDFELQDYSNITGFANFYYRNYQPFPFDLKISYGEYLAGDVGGTIELSRTFINGARFGVFATFTDVTPDQFGEGTFDKGIFFRIPFGNNFSNFLWRPLTKDPGAKLVRKNTLHDLLARFKSVN